MTNDLSKVYANLDPAQLAVLFYNHIADDDELERQRVLASVPQKPYLTNHIAFTLKHMDLMRVMMTLPTVYWKAKADYYQRLYSGMDEAQALARYNATVLAIQHCLEGLGVVESVIRVHFMDDAILDPINDDAIDWEFYDQFSAMLAQQGYS